MPYDIEQLKRLDGVRIDEKTGEVFIDLAKLDDNPELWELFHKGLLESIQRDPVRRAAWNRVWDKLLAPHDTP
jgi:hypothetical protein